MCRLSLLTGFYLCVTACAAGQSPHPILPAEITSDERWIEIDLSTQMVNLHAGDQVLAGYPAATGVNSSPETTTYTGLFKVSKMIKGPIMTVPGVYVRDVIIFDLEHGNGIHSQPMDSVGNLLDETLGTPVTAGCIRVGESGAVFAFAKMGMKIWVH